jgi:DNA polymerase-1
MSEPRIYFDFETTGLNPFKGDRIFLGGMEDEKGNVTIGEPGTPQFKKIKAALENPNVEKEGWNVKFDLKMAEASGIKTKGLVHDGMLKTYMNNEYEPNLKLKDCARRHLGEPGTEEKEVKDILSRLRRAGKKDVNYSDVPRKIMRKYLEKDLDDTVRMGWKMQHVEDGPQRRVYNIERSLIPNVVKMEQWGIHIDKDYCERQLKTVLPRIEQAKKVMHNEAGVQFNPNSGQQLSIVLRDRGIDTGEQNKDGSMKLDVKYLRGLRDDPFIASLLEYRNLKKIGGTYFQAFLEHQVDGIIHPSFWPFGQDHGIKTGRFSSSDPNFQNIPGGGRGDNEEMLRDPGWVRRCVTPRSDDYVFLLGDYKQIEFVIFACSVGDQGMIRDLRNGIDAHTANAYRLFGRNCMDNKTKDEMKRTRFLAKELNFSFIFGMGVAACSTRMGVQMVEAKRLKNKFFSEVPAARDFLMRSQADLLRDGYVQDQFGRRYHVPRDLCYKAANCLCQGPAALVMKRGINRAYKMLSHLDAHPFITVHDELGVEVRRDQVWECAEIMYEALEDRENFSVPIQTELSIAEKSWADKQSWLEVKDKWKPRRKIKVRK